MSDSNSPPWPNSGSRPVLEVCRAALARGPLVRDGHHWRYGRRLFNHATVKQLIDEGIAVRDGSRVRQASDETTRILRWGSPAASACADDRAERLAHSLLQRRVLVVEDDCMIASLLNEDLKELGFVVVGPVGNLAEALATASASALDCALVDIALGNDSALPVAQVLADRRIPFMFMTGAPESPEGTFQEIPALLKPFSVEELRGALQRILSV